MELLELRVGIFGLPAVLGVRSASAVLGVCGASAGLGVGGAFAVPGVGSASAVLGVGSASAVLGVRSTSAGLGLGGAFAVLGVCGASAGLGVRAVLMRGLFGDQEIEGAERQGLSLLRVAPMRALAVRLVELPQDVADRCRSRGRGLVAGVPAARCSVLTPVLIAALPVHCVQRVQVQKVRM